MKNILLENELEQISNIEKNEFIKYSYNLSELNFFNKNNLYNFFIYKKNNLIVSYAIILETIDSVEILKIATLNKFRKNGYGTKILNDIKKNYKKNIYIDVSTKNNTIIFYEKNNFKKIGIRKNYYLDKSDAIVMKF